MTRRLAGAPPTEAPAEGSDKELVNLELGAFQGAGGGPAATDWQGGWGARGVSLELSVNHEGGPLWLDAWLWFGPGSK